MESRRLRRLVSRVVRAAVVAATAALVVQWTFRISVDETTFGRDPLDIDAHSSVPLPNVTVWELVRDDRRVSKFVDIVSQFGAIVGGLKAPQASFTLFVPTNEAFDKDDFAWDLPSFYWLYLVGYHMVRGAFSQRDLASHVTTVPSFVWADIFETYRQRISTQRLDRGRGLSLNHRARPVSPDRAAVNGYVHLIDRVLMMPESTSDLLRDDPQLSTLRRALIQTDVAVIVNDTSTHLGQTVFAPSNSAFNKLGAKANEFLFSPYGREYLTALLRYHIVANRTMFTDVLFPHNGEALVPLEVGSKIDLPTLLPTHNLSVTIDRDGSRLSPKINGAVQIGQPDIIVMDGVIQKIDTVLLPPLRSHPDKGELGPPWSWINALQEALLGPSGLPVGELKKRLEPLVDGYDL
ncbi:hypothetical protein VTO42DRAFT_2107 [Malbranchea cinnamomea]